MENKVVTNVVCFDSLFLFKNSLSPSIVSQIRKNDLKIFKCIKILLFKLIPFYFNCLHVSTSG